MEGGLSDSGLCIILTVANTGEPLYNRVLNVLIDSACMSLPTRFKQGIHGPMSLHRGAKFEINHRFTSYRGNCKKVNCYCSEDVITMIRLLK